MHFDWTKRSSYCPLLSLFWIKPSPRTVIKEIQRADLLQIRKRRCIIGIHPIQYLEKILVTYIQIGRFWEKGMEIGVGLVCKEYVVLGFGFIHSNLQGICCAWIGCSTEAAAVKRNWYKKRGHGSIKKISPLC